MPPPWLVDWMRAACVHRQIHSIVLRTTGDTPLESIAHSVADYLNEFDDDGACQWRFFDADLLQMLANDPASRNLVLADPQPDQDHDQRRPDLERVVHRLACLGGVILEGTVSHDATIHLPGTFHICLSPTKPANHPRFHMWVNAPRFPLPGLVCVIANSFLDWVSHREAAGPQVSASESTR